MAIEACSDGEEGIQYPWVFPLIALVGYERRYSASE